MKNIPSDFYDRFPELRGLDPAHLRRALLERLAFEDCLDGPSEPSEPEDREALRIVKQRVLSLMKRKSDFLARQEDSPTERDRGVDPLTNLLNDWDEETPELDQSFEAFDEMPDPALVGSASSSDLDWFTASHGLGTEDITCDEDVEALTVCSGPPNDGTELRIEGFPHELDGSRVKVVHLRSSPRLSRDADGRVQGGATTVQFPEPCDPPLQDGDLLQIECQCVIAFPEGSTFRFEIEYHAPDGGDRSSHRRE
ncbi:MAG: hypothetical protein H6834_17040 [Planctomycetes bacterium]|nr:hypothetical protein [Planctomycetota bacterium]